ncbi:hypothetical protein, partial [Leclercia adecarboxylata]|uniref:hypothetical protein n=1 Tax=Leclercia adecarboxylata TaxID=83655 RepID=UPI001F1B4B0C
LKRSTLPPDPIKGWRLNLQHYINKYIGVINMNAHKYLKKYEHHFKDADEGMKEFIISMLEDDDWRDFTKKHLEEQNKKIKAEMKK